MHLVFVEVPKARQKTSIARLLLEDQLKKFVVLFEPLIYDQSTSPICFSTDLLMGFSERYLVAIRSLEDLNISRDINEIAS